MKKEIHHLLLTLVFFLLLDSTLAASRASFCKCTCKTNSTIIALDSPPSSPNTVDPGSGSGSSSASPDDSTGRDILAGAADDAAGSTSDGGKPRQRSCADCNRQFCLMYDLPKLDDCKSENRGREDEIVATCFQRDSAKDQAVVYTFILLTVGLLCYAAIKPYVEKRMEAQGENSGSYEQVPTRPTGLGTG